jgi:hypothetical membrane protein
MTHSTKLLALSFLWQIAGITGSLVIITTCGTASLQYQGVHEEAYSLLNHFISELGDPKYSKGAIIFNLGLILGGLFLIIFMFGLAKYYSTKLSYSAGIIGMFASLMCSLIGFFPVNLLNIHFIFTTAFFIGGLASITLFAIEIVRDKRKQLPKWFAIPGFMGVGCFTVFLIMLYGFTDGFQPSLSPFIIKPNEFSRPAFWLFPFTEWLVLITALIWIFLTSIYVIKKKYDSK